MKRKTWTENETELARQLLKTHSYATVGKMLHRSKNSVIGQFYREKVVSRRNGMVVVVLSVLWRFVKWRSIFFQKNGYFQYFKCNFDNFFLSKTVGCLFSNSFLSLFAQKEQLFSILTGRSWLLWAPESAKVAKTNKKHMFFKDLIAHAPKTNKKQYTCDTMHNNSTPICWFKQPAVVIFIKRLDRGYAKI